ncbi:MAG: Uma2 family endonuclease [Chloroflexi bacterium]|nr:Uma2 family endonuclease [Chloroflexota bacterium]
MATTTRLMTADDLLGMADDGLRYELVRGELLRIMGTGLEHALIADNCYGSIRDYVRNANLGRVFTSQLGYRLASDPDTVRIPDLAFIRRERLEAVGVIKGYFPGPPDLAIEVISPNDRYRDVESKLSDYFAARTRMVILLEPDGRTAKVYRSPTDVVVLMEADTLDGADVVPGWRMPVSEIFD